MNVVGLIFHLADDCQVHSEMGREGIEAGTMARVFVCIIILLLVRQTQLAEFSGHGACTAPMTDTAAHVGERVSTPPSFR